MEFFWIWLSGFVLTKNAEAMIERLSSTSLPGRLEKTAERWAHDLPLEAELLRVSGLFADTLADTRSSESELPKSVFDELERHHIPSTDDWTELFLWHWHRVKDIQPEPAAFFTLDEPTAEGHLRELAGRIVAECEKDRELFQGETLRRLNQVEQGLQEIKDISCEPVPHQKFSLQIDEDHVLPSADNGYQEQFYLRVKIRNMGPKIAHDCRGYLEDFEERNASTGVFESVFSDPVPLIRSQYPQCEDFDVPGEGDGLVDVVRYTKRERGGLTFRCGARMAFSDRASWSRTARSMGPINSASLSRLMVLNRNE